MRDELVSIIIPTKNSAQFLENCLRSIHQQSYKRIEVIIVDGKSTDGTVQIGRKYKARIETFVPKVKQGIFDAPHKRNYGVKKAKGNYVYYFDADMELPKDAIKEAVKLCQKKYDAVILPEDSFGTGMWAQAKNLERRCIWGDDTQEAPRFIKKTAWEAVGGIDESIGGGGDDWDLYQKLLENGYKVGRTKSIVRSNEGALQLTGLLKKRFRYGRESLKYISKRPKAGFSSYFPIKKAYIRNWRLFVQRPKDTAVFIIMRTAEYGAGFAGIIYATLKK